MCRLTSQEGVKGSIVPGQLVDLVVLSEDYFFIPEDSIKRLESVLIIVGGKPVYAKSEFKDLNPPPLPVSPNWSPVAYYGGYKNSKAISTTSYVPTHVGCCSPSQARSANNSPVSLNNVGSLSSLWGNMGCACFV
ncbi:hypothetical protein NIES267_43170 [Calothrix parasitica NIES-267]|uniref:Amidohydrolase 3 domain-containing protein n=1 Tax=Calothrix parasitica NIES-267 TaxID=1973488 RepID=A0A1Z4LU99_9CYAN|nr:hypothetical protein NIES267_43170 [Calothrix parasitica NIES-267]